MAFAIFTDTAANLNRKILSENKITAIPLPYFSNGKENMCTDIDSFNDTEYYNALKGGMKVTTSQINPQKYVEYFEPQLKNGKDILHIAISSGISGAYASALIAKKELSEKYPNRIIAVVDSLAASLGEGIVVIRATEYRKKGFDILETAEKLKELTKRIYQVFIVDDLAHLHRTGRISGAATVIGQALGIRPVLKGDESGKIVMVGKVRGKLSAIKQLAEKYHVLVKNPQLVGISYAGCVENAESLKKLITNKSLPLKTIIEKHEPATGAHLGPGALAIYFEGDEEVRKQ